MKTSKKILIGLAALVLLTMVVGLVILRRDLHMLQAKEASLHPFRTISTDPFRVLNLSAHWSASIKQGDHHKVEIGSDSLWKVTCKTINDTLYLVASGDNLGTAYTQQLNVRITLPALSGIKAAGNAQLHMEKFEADSVHIQLEDSTVFTGKGSKIKQVIFQTKGKAQIKLEHNPDEL